MSAGGNYGPLGYLEDTAETDLLYIRRDEYNVRGQIGTYDNSAGDFSVLPPGSNGTVLTARPALSNGLAWETPGAITVTGSQFLTVTGSPVSLGGTVTLTNTALNDYFGVGDWGAGNSISFGAGSQNTILIGNSSSSSTASNGAIALGAQAQTSDSSIAIGRQSSALVTNAIAIGNGVVNSTPNSALIGNSTAFIVRSAGSFESAVQEGAAAGRIPTDAAPSPQTIASGATATVNIYSTRYADGGTTVGNYLAAAPNTNTLGLIKIGNHYSASAVAMFTISGASSGDIVVLTLQWSSDNGATWQTLGQNMWAFSGGQTSGGISTATSMKTTGAVTNLLRCQLQNNTSRTLTVTMYRIASDRNN